jgi:AGZA family xanthine/uracil permease-like MFS transporter
VTYEEALAAIFVEAWIFIFISLVGLRGRLIELVPKHIMLATAVGIGERGSGGTGAGVMCCG